MQPEAKATDQVGVQAEVQTRKLGSAGRIVFAGDVMTTLYEHAYNQDLLILYILRARLLVLV